MFVQNFIKQSPVVHELSCSLRADNTAVASAASKNENTGSTWLEQ